MHWLGTFEASHGCDFVCWERSCSLCSCQWFSPWAKFSSPLIGCFSISYFHCIFCFSSKESCLLVWFVSLFTMTADCDLKFAWSFLKVLKLSLCWRIHQPFAKPLDNSKLAEIASKYPNYSLWPFLFDISRTQHHISYQFSNSPVESKLYAQNCYFLLSWRFFLAPLSPLE